MAYMCVVASDHAWAGHFPRYRTVGTVDTYGTYGTYGRYRGKDGKGTPSTRGATSAGLAMVAT